MSDKYVDDFDLTVAFDKHLVSQNETIETIQVDNFITKLIKNIKNTFSGILEDIRKKNYNNIGEFIAIFIKDNRILYFGVFLIFICIILFIMSFLFYTKQKKKINKSNKVQRIINNNSPKKNIGLEDIYEKITDLNDKIKMNNLNIELLNQKSN